MTDHIDRMLGEPRSTTKKTRAKTTTKASEKPKRDSRGRPPMDEGRAAVQVRMPPALFARLKRHLLERQLAGERIAIGETSREIDAGDVIAEALDSFLTMRKG